jgi:hypothetical protein
MYLFVCECLQNNLKSNGMNDKTQLFLSIVLVNIYLVVIIVSMIHVQNVSVY